MTDPIRDLLISLASHMSYMQGQLEARHELDDPEDYYWYRESVLLRQKVTDALADEPAVPEGREPAAVLARWGNPAPTLPADVSQLSDGYHTFAELYEHRHSLMLALMRAQPHICWFSRRHADGELPFGSDGWFIVGAELPDAPITYHLPAGLYSLAQKTGAIELPAGRPWDGHTAADVVRRLRAWAITPPPPADGELVEWLMVTAGGEESFGRVRRTRAADLLQRLSPPQPPADGEVAKLVKWLRQRWPRMAHISDPDYAIGVRIGDLMERLSPSQPVAVSERLPVAEDCDAEGRCWVWWKNGVRWVLDEWTHHELREGPLSDCVSHWLPAYALPVPGQEVEG